jgi:hypothetical protein
MVLKCSYPLIQISHFWEITLKEIIWNAATNLYQTYSLEFYLQYKNL